MSRYSVRPATLDDADTLVRHRIKMFDDMGIALDAPAPMMFFAIGKV